MAVVYQIPLLTKEAAGANLGEMLSAALALLLASPLWAAPAPLCVPISSMTAEDQPDSLQDLLDCQKDKLGDFATDYETKHKTAPSSATLDRWQDAQQAEVRAFLSRNPGMASLDQTVEAAIAEDAKPKDPAMMSDWEKLQAGVKKKSEGGKKGITSGSAADITDYLKEKQGGVSPDMAELLDSVQKDGGTLSAGTMEKLKAAAKAAKGGGMDLGVKPEIEQGLMAPPDVR